MWSLPPWLRGDKLLNVAKLCTIQVYLDFVFILFLICLFRGCDSRNINLSLFCDLKERKTLQEWAENFSKEYKGKKTEYIANLKYAKRPFYATDKMKDQEIISSLTKTVSYFPYECLQLHINVKLWLLGSRIQCFWKGFSGCEHFLWHPCSQW